tara:strand:+ start:1353 stop:1808 length:456 start_codon:yes stop_codon:yes gene_type:complete
MFAIIRKDGKQYRVSKGETIKFDRILSEPGDAFETNEVLAVSKKDGDLRFGNPILDNTKVVGKVLRHGKDKKIIVFKRKRRKTYRRKYGHRQLHTIVKIESISIKNLADKKVKSELAVSKDETSEKKQVKIIKPTKSSSKNISKEKVSKKE